MSRLVLSRRDVSSCYRHGNSEGISSICKGRRGAFPPADARRRPDAKLGCTTSAETGEQAEGDSPELYFAELVHVHVRVRDVPGEKAARRGPRNSAIVDACAYRVSSLINRVTGVDAIHPIHIFRPSSCPSGGLLRRYRARRALLTYAEKKFVAGTFTFRFTSNVITIYK